MIKFEEPFNGRMCNCCHKEDNLVEFDFRSDFNNSGVCVALCRECRTNLREILRIVDDILSLETPCLYPNEVERAIFKQKPLMPFYTINQYGLKVWRCGSCESGIDKTMKYCYECGHKIKWEVDSDE